MADAVATRVLGETASHYVVHFTNLSDGTGESAVVKVDKSALKAPDGAEPASLDIEKIEWSCDGMVVQIKWDHTSPDVAVYLGGHGVLDFTKTPNVAGSPTGLMKDPRSSGGAGDITFTTSGHTSGDSYNVTLWLRKQSD